MDPKIGHFPLEPCFKLQTYAHTPLDGSVQQHQQVMQQIDNETNQWSPALANFAAFRRRTSIVANIVTFCLTVASFLQRVPTVVYNTFAAKQNSVRLVCGSRCSNGQTFSRSICCGFVLNLFYA